MTTIPGKPKFLPRYTPISLEEDNLFLYSAVNSLNLHSEDVPLMRQLLHLLDGQHTIDDLQAQLPAFDAAQIAPTLEALDAAGLLDHPDPHLLEAFSSEELQRYEEQLTFFSHFVASSLNGDTSLWPDIPKHELEYQHKLKEASIAVFGLGRLGSQLVRALTLSGVGRITGVEAGNVSLADLDGGGWFLPEHIGAGRAEALASLVEHTNPWVAYSPVGDWFHSVDEVVTLLGEHSFAILCTDHYNADDYETFNIACQTTGTNWTSCRVNGFELSIGPSIIPRKTPCYKCFQLRLLSNIDDVNEHKILENYSRNGKLRSGALTITPGVEITALEVIKAITFFMEPSTYAHFFTLNLLTLEARLHPILKLPRCPHCGRATQARPTIHVWQQIRDREQP